MSFVKKNLQKAHSALLQRLIVGVGIVEQQAPRGTSTPSSPHGTVGSVSSKPVPSPMMQRQSMRDIIEQKQWKAASSSSGSPELANVSPSSQYTSREFLHPHHVAELPADTPNGPIAELDSSHTSDFASEYGSRPPVPSRDPRRSWER